MTSQLHRAAVVGHPVAHSLSPAIHSAWASAAGASYQYNRIDPGTEALRFDDLVSQIAAEGYRGVNVTIPFKERACAIATRKSARAAAIGAANMLTFSGGELFADNSDATGFADAVAAALGGGRIGSALVLGAGGSARSIVFALKEIMGVVSVSVSNRTAARAAALADAFGCHAVDWRRRGAAAADVGLVVNTTSVGMTNQGVAPEYRPSAETPLDLDGVSAAVCDIVYSPLETPLLAAARARGLIAIDGLEMLVRQAVPGFLAWSGAEATPSIDLARSVCLEELSGRRSA